MHIHINFTYYFLGPLHHFSEVQVAMVITSTCTIDEAMAHVGLTLDGSLKLLEGLSLCQVLGVYYGWGYIILISSFFLHPFCWRLCLQLVSHYFCSQVTKLTTFFISSNTACVSSFHLGD